MRTNLGGSVAQAHELGTGAPVQIGGASRFVVDVRESSDIHIGDVYVAPGEVSWPVRVGVAPPMAAAFQPRADLRDQVDAALSGGQVAVITQVLQGDGGTGKTQLAAAVFRDATAGRDVDVAVWVTATTRDAVVSAFARAAAALHLPPSPDKDEMAAAFLAWLTGTERAWLIVLDDVADPADLRGLWPTGPTGRVMVTTRRRDVTRTLGSRTPPVDVGTYTPEEAVAYLVERLTPEDALTPARGVLEEAERLAEDLGFLPVALAQAAAVISDDDSTCAELRRQLTTTGRQLEDLFPADSADQYGLTLAAVWRIALTRADALAPAGLASPLALLAAVLDPAGFPEALLTTEAARTYLAAPDYFNSLAAQQDDADEETEEAPDDDGPEIPPVDEALARRALRNLHRLNVVTHEAPLGSRAVRVHALAQRAVREQAGESATAVAYVFAAYALMEGWPEPPSDAALQEALRANATVLAERCPDLLDDEDVNGLFFTAGRSLLDAGLYRQAVAYWQNLGDRLEQALGAEDPDTLVSRANLAFARLRAGRPGEAVTAYENMLPALERLMGPRHPQTLAARNNLALARLQAGRPAAAVTAYEELVPVLEEVLGANDRGTLQARSNLAHSRLLAGHAAQSAATYADLIPIMESSLGANDHDTLGARINFAGARLEGGYAAEAASTYGELMPVLEQVLGINHPDVLAARANLAYAQLNAGHPAEAATAYQQLVPDLVQALGEDHPSTLQCRANFAMARLQAGHPGESVRVYEELLPAMEHVLGSRHPDILTARGNLALGLLQTGRPAEALAEYGDLLPTVADVLGPGHPSTLQLRANLVGARLQLGDADAAVSGYDELLPSLGRVLGPDHPVTLQARSGRASALLRSGASAEAAAAFQDVLATMERTMGTNHPATLQARANMAIALLRTDRAAESAAAGEASLLALERTVGADHLDAMTVRSTVAAAYLAMEDWATAESAYSRCLKWSMQRFGPDHWQTIALRFGLATAIAGSGDLATAMQTLPDVATWPRTADEYAAAVWRHRESVQFHRKHHQPQAERAHLERLALLHDRFGAMSEDVDADLARLEALTQQRRDTEEDHA